ncbi:MAG: prepilin-type N-terminal cleavage/methylation domain-containing protein [Deltaproteobacteria bacterium]|nr:MAG: prepilin-type N-terminal cleavage/methylation domain-containing protein [Deltaproteobacteria bacterium]
MNGVKNVRPESLHEGFTLVEVLISMVIALVVLGGLLATFQGQYGHYKYQHQQSDAVQDMEAVLRVIGDDLKGALVIGGTPQVTITPDPYTSPSAATTDLKTLVWEPNPSFWGAVDPYTQNYRAERHYVYDPVAKSLRLDRNTRDGGDSPTEILSNVTWFQVWQGDPYAGLVDAPPADPYGAVLFDEKGNHVTVPQYTVLIEMEVPVGYKGGKKVDVFGNATALPMVHRYLQVYPNTAFSQ